MGGPITGIDHALVGELDATAGHLDAAGEPYLRDADTLLGLPTEPACGVVLEFSAD